MKIVLKSMMIITLLILELKMILYTLKNFKNQIKTI